MNQPKTKRKPYLAGTFRHAPDMALPEGKTCGDCVHFRRTCSWLVSCHPENSVCDWSPHRFRPETTS